MKIKLARKYIKFNPAKNFLIAALIFVGACRPAPERFYSEATKEIEKGHFRIAVDLIEKSAQVEKDEKNKFKYLIEAARITRFEIQDYERAIKFYKTIILQSQNEKQRIDAQQAVAEIYLENLQNYSKALQELQTLEPLIKTEKEKQKIKLKIAQAQYLTGNYQAAIEEIEVSLKISKLEILNFLKLKAQVLVAQKKYRDAIDTYQEILRRDPKYFELENLFIATSVVYEENEDYAEALNYLTKYENKIKDKAYYELRYKRLNERLINKPFYKGKRK